MQKMMLEAEVTSTGVELNRSKNVASKVGPAVGTNSGKYSSKKSLSRKFIPDGFGKKTSKDKKSKDKSSEDKKSKTKKQQKSLQVNTGTLYREITATQSLSTMPTLSSSGSASEDLNYGYTRHRQATNSNNVYTMSSRNPMQSPTHHASQQLVKTKSHRDKESNSMTRSIELAEFSEMYGEPSGLNRSGLLIGCSPSFGSALMSDYSSKIKSSHKQLASPKMNHRKPSFQQRSKSKSSSRTSSVVEGRHDDDTSRGLRSAQAGGLNNERDGSSLSHSQIEYSIRKTRSEGNCMLGYEPIQRRTSGGLKRKTDAELNEIAFKQAQEMSDIMEMTTEGLELNPDGMKLLQAPASTYSLKSTLSTISAKEAARMYAGNQQSTAKILFKLRSSARKKNVALDHDLC